MEKAPTSGAGRLWSRPLATGLSEQFTRERILQAGLRTCGVTELLRTSMTTYHTTGMLFLHPNDLTTSEVSDWHGPSPQGHTQRSPSWRQRRAEELERLHSPFPFPVTGGSDGKESACNAGDLGLIPGLGRSPGGGKGYPI